MPYVCRKGADTLVKLSEYGKISNFLTLNVVDVFVAEFQESIRSAIPQIIDLLGSSLDVCIVATNALVKLSEQGKVSNFLT